MTLFSKNPVSPVRIRISAMNSLGTHSGTFRSRGVIPKAFQKVKDALSFPLLPSKFKLQPVPKVEMCRIDQKVKMEFLPVQTEVNESVLRCQIGMTDGKDGKIYLKNPEIQKSVSPPSSDAGYDSDTEACEAFDLDELKLDLPENITDDEDQGQDVFTLSSARTEDDVSSDIFDEDYEYLDDVIECEDEDIFDHVTDHVNGEFPVTDNAVRDILTNDVAIATNFPVDTGTEDRAEICPDILDSAKTENDVASGIFDADYDNVTEDVATYASFLGDVSKDTDNDVSSDIFDTHVTNREHQTVEYHECDDSARTDNDVNSDIFDDSEDVFISIKSDC